MVQKFNDFIQSADFCKSNEDYCPFSKKVEDTSYTWMTWSSLADMSQSYPTFVLEGKDMKLVPHVPEVSSLMYVMVVTRPTLAHAIGVISKFMHNPDRLHLNEVKHRLRCLVCTQVVDILFDPNKNSNVVSYTDLDFVRSVDSRKQTTEYFFNFAFNSKILSFRKNIM